MNTKPWSCSQRLSQHFRVWARQHHCIKTVSYSSKSRHFPKKMAFSEKNGQIQDFTKIGALKANTGTLTGRTKHVVSVEGNIGCGKSVMLDYFGSTHDCETIAEPVHKWRDIKGHNALELMYQDPEQYGIVLQTYIQLTMLQIHTLPQEKPVRLMERSIFSAKYCFVENLFRSQKMEPVKYHVLTEWFDWIIKTQTVDIDLIVYLRTDPKILHERIMKRCRPEEQCIPLDYLKSLHQMHDDWLIHKKFPCPAEVLIIDANSAMEEVQESYEQHRSRIVQHSTC